MSLSDKILDDLKKAKGHLEYSYAKVRKLKLETVMGEETLETLESFASRFSRLSDLVISRYFRALALEKDPAFRGSVIDLLNQAEKFGWIDSADRWKRIRELRNLAAHEYSPTDTLDLYRELIDLTPDLLKVPVSG